MTPSVHHSSQTTLRLKSILLSVHTGQRYKHPGRREERKIKLSKSRLASSYHQGHRNPRKARKVINPKVKNGKKRNSVNFLEI